MPPQNRTLILSVSYILWIVFLISSVILLRGILVIPKCLDFDSQRGILAARQFETSRSPSLVRLVVADPDNIEKVITKPECWRAPGYQAIPYAIRSLGVSWGESIQITIAFFVFLGVFFWLACYRNCLHFPWAIPALGCAIVLSPIIVESFRVYDSGDLLLFGTAPVAIFINIRAHACSRRVAAALSTLGGLTSVLLFLVKYSGIFSGFGIGLAWLIHAIFDKDVRKLFVFWLFGCLAGVGVILALGYPWGPSPSSSIGTLLRVDEAFMALGTWPAAMADAAEPLRRIGKALGITEIWIRHFGTPLIGLLFVLSTVCLSRSALQQSFSQWLIALRNREASAWWPYSVLGCVFLLDLGCYSLMILLGGGVEVTSRLARISALAAFPLVLSLALRTRDSSWTRFLILSTTISLLVVPGPVLGAFRLVQLVTQPAATWSNPTLGPLRIEGLGTNFAEQQAVIDEILQYGNDSNRVILAPEPGFMYMASSNPLLLVYTDSMTDTQLDSLCFRGHPKHGVMLILPSKSLQLSKQVRSAFKDIDTWNVSQLSSDDRWEIWISQ